MVNLNEKERMNIVIVGHVDHGKSTVIGRLLADTNSLPEGKLESVKKYCERNSRPFEYAFLLDALKEEQSQGITIDTARCFFKTNKRQYVIIDAPGHIEFLKNMVTGASRAEAAALVIDAKEGIKENSKRHGYLLSMLGIKNIVILVNKMDLVDYNKEKFLNIVDEFNVFLKNININPKVYIPISAINGENIAFKSEKMRWYEGPIFLEVIDSFEKEESDENKPFRMPVQDIYKFTEDNDDRRIIAGTVLTGEIKIGDDVIFYPSFKKAKIKTIESFNEEKQFKLTAGMSKGFTLDTQIYIKRGELACKIGEKPSLVNHSFKVNLFWMGKNPMIYNKKYKLKINTTKEIVMLEKILNIIDASDLTTESNKQQIDKFDVAQCVLKTIRPIAFDLTSDNQKTGRFVIVDEYDIAGGGIILESLEQEKSIYDEQVNKREFIWNKSQISAIERANRFKQKPKFIVITGTNNEKIDIIARELEKILFSKGKNVYYLTLSQLLSGLESDINFSNFDRDEHIRRIGELARIITDIGIIFITGISELDDFELEQLKILNKPYEIIVIDIDGISNKREEIYSFSSDKSKEEILKIVENILLEKNIVEYYI